MQKITLNTVIITIASLILISLFIYGLQNIEYLFIFILFPMTFSFILSLPLIWYIKSQKILKILSYITFVFVAILSLYHLLYYNFYLYTNFYGYNNFEEFLYEYPHTNPDPLISFILGNFRLFFMADLFFISFSTVFLLGLCLKIYKLENKKEG